MDRMFSTNTGEKVNSFAGKILIATPQMDDSVFEHAMVFICAHDEQGCVGVMFNKPISTVSTKSILEQNGIKKRFKLDKKYTIFSGGPVDDDKLFVMSANKVQEKEFEALGQLTLYTNAEGFLKDVVTGKNSDKFILSKGFCGWAPGQLEQEIKDNFWMLTDAKFKAIFSGDPKTKWEQAIKKIGIKNLDALVTYSGNA